MFIFSQKLHVIGVTLILQTLLIRMLLSTLMNNFWYPYLILLILFGGLFILFTYIISRFTETFTPTIKKFLIIISPTIFTLYIAYIFPYNHLTFINSKINLLFNIPTNMLIITIILYLLISLTIAIKISFTNSSSFRKI